MSSYSPDVHHQAACRAVLCPGARVEHPPTTDGHNYDDDDHHHGDNDVGYEGNLEVLAACLQLFALDNVGVDTSGLKAR